MRRSFNHGFTLIELLIVIAIILILIAIALPNFLEAQIRARVTRAKAEIRTIGTAMEAYYLDWEQYPSYSFPNYTRRGRLTAGLTWLTSPIAYITSLPEDPFPPNLDQEGSEITGPPYTYTLDGFEVSRQELGLSHPHDCRGIVTPLCGNLAVWALYSVGPDTPKAEARPHDNATPIFNHGAPIHSYAPTNGTTSRGDLFRYGGDQRWMGVNPNNDIIANRSQFLVYPKPGQFVDGVLYISRFPSHLVN